MACMRPIPRTSPIPWKRSLSPSSPSRSTLPIICELKRSFSSSITSSVASEAAMETGEPPKVEICAKRPASAMGAFAMVRPIGWPFAMPFALVRMSGSAPNCWTPHHLPPLRPHAVSTSPALHGPPRRLCLVGDEEAARVADDGQRDVEVFLGRHDEPADALDGLHQERGDLP